MYGSLLRMNATPSIRQVDVHVFTATASSGQSMSHKWSPLSPSFCFHQLHVMLFACMRCSGYLTSGLERCSRFGWTLYDIRPGTCSLSRPLILKMRNGRCHRRFGDHWSLQLLVYCQQPIAACGRDRVGWWWWIDSNQPYRQPVPTLSDYGWWLSSPSHVFSFFSRLIWICSKGGNRSQFGHVRYPFCHTCSNASNLLFI